MGGKVQRISSINGKYKIDRGRLGIVWEMEKANNLYVLPLYELREGNVVGRGGAGQRGIKGKKMGQLY